MQNTSTKGNALIFHMLQVKQLLGQYIWEFLKPRGPQLKNMNVEQIFAYSQMLYRITCDICT